MNYETLYQIAKSDSMIGRVTIAVIRVALSIRTEDEKLFPNHSLRDLLAKKVLNAPEQIAGTFALMVVVSNEVIAKTVSAGKGDLTDMDDTQIEKSVLEIWDSLA